MVKTASKALALERLKPFHPSCYKSRIGNPRAYRNIKKNHDQIVQNHFVFYQNLPHLDWMFWLKIILKKTSKERPVRKPSKFTNFLNELNLMNCMHFLNFSWGGIHETRHWRSNGKWSLSCHIWRLHVVHHRFSLDLVLWFDPDHGLNLILEKKGILV